MEHKIKEEIIMSLTAEQKAKLAKFEEGFKTSPEYRSFVKASEAAHTAMARLVSNFKG